MKKLPNDLHALPDSDVMEACLPGIRERRLAIDDAISALRSDPGWMPVAIEPEGNLVYFVNVAEKGFDRWQFVYSVASLVTDDAASAFGSFSTDIEILDAFDFGAVSGWEAT